MAKSKVRSKAPVKSRWDVVYVHFEGRLIAHTRNDGLLFCSRSTLLGLPVGARAPVELSLARKDVSSIRYVDEMIDNDTTEPGEDILGLEVPRWLAEDRCLTYEEVDT